MLIVTPNQWYEMCIKLPIINWENIQIDSCQSVNIHRSANSFSMYSTHIINHYHFWYAHTHTQSVDNWRWQSSIMAMTIFGKINEKNEEKRKEKSFGHHQLIWIWRSKTRDKRAKIEKTKKNAIIVVPSWRWARRTHAAINLVQLSFVPNEVPSAIEVAII